MALDVEVPDPPPLRGPQSRGEYEAIDMTDEQPEDDYRREAIEGFLEEGAWREAFGEWAEYTYLTEEEFEVVTDLNLIEAFDFYWDPNADEVGYRAPTLPDDLPEPHDATLDPGDVEGIEEELDSLGRTVSEMLENDYVLRDEEEFGFFSEE